jgi:hypothetical protein
MIGITQDPQNTGDDPTTDVAAGGNGENASGATASGATASGATASGETVATGSETTATNETPKWIYQLSGDLQKDDRLTGFGKPDELAKAYLDYAGKADRLVELPGEDDQDGWNDFYGKLGRPEGPDGYDFAEIKTDGIAGIDELELKEFRELAHKLGLTQYQAKQLLEHSVNELQGIVSNAETEEKSKQEQADKQAAEQKAKVEAEKQKRIEALKTKYGDNLSEVVEKAHRAYLQVGNQELGKVLDETGLGDDPIVVDAFLSIADMIGEDSLVGGGEAGKVEDTWYPNTKFG